MCSYLELPKLCQKFKNRFQENVLITIMKYWNETYLYVSHLFEQKNHSLSIYYMCVYECVVLVVQIKYKMFNFFTVIHGGSIRKLPFTKSLISFKEFILILCRLSLSFPPTKKLKNNGIMYLVKRIKIYFIPLGCLLEFIYFIQVI